jgi:hypothetical protein
MVMSATARVRINFFRYVAPWKSPECLPIALRTAARSSHLFAPDDSIVLAIIPHVIT